MVAFIRNQEEQNPSAYVGNLLFWLASPYVFFALLPEVYLSTFLRPGQEILPVDFQRKSSLGKGYIFS